MPITLRQGLHTLRLHKKSFLLFYVLNLGLALTIAIPFAIELDHAIGDTAYRESLTQTMDLEWLAWFQHQTGPTGKTLTPSILGAGPFLRNLDLLLTGAFLGLPSRILLLWALYWVVHNFLLAAALGSMATDPGGTTLREFFRSGSEFFGRFLRLGLLALCLTGGLILLFAIPARSFLLDIVATAPTDRMAWLAVASALCMAGCVIWLLRVVADYARIQMAICDRSSVVLAYGAALSFLASNPVGALGLSLFLTLIPVGLAGIYTGLDTLLPQTSGATILMALLLQQSFVLSRMAARVYGLATQMHFVLSREALFRPAPNTGGGSTDALEGPSLPVLQ